MASEEQRESTGQAREPTEEELRAAYEAQVKRLRVEHVVLETVVSLANLGMRRTGQAPGTEDERDPQQVRLAIEAMRALMPLAEQAAPEQARAIRDALSQLQLAYVRIGGPQAGGAGGEASSQGGGSGSQPGGSGAGGSGPEPAQSGSPPGGKPDEPGPAQRSGRLWVPGQ